MWASAMPFASRSTRKQERRRPMIATCLVVALAVALFSAGMLSTATPSTFSGPAAQAVLRESGPRHAPSSGANNLLSPASRAGGGPADAQSTDGNDRFWNWAAALQHSVAKTSSFVMCVALVAVTAFTPTLAARARDGAIAPPTCVSIVDAQTNCPARLESGAFANVEKQYQDAMVQLKIEEDRKGGPMRPEDMPPPPTPTLNEDGTVDEAPELPESQRDERPRLMAMVDFYRAEYQRLVANRDFLEELRTKLQKDDARFLSRLAVYSPDPEKEVKFWCEAMGMQRYANLPDGGIVVAYGPPSIRGSDEGAFFALEVRPASLLAASSSASTPSTKLSFVQIATPSLIRVSKITSSGADLTDGYGYFGITSPSGVQVRAYVDDRRDPFELVAVVSTDADISSSRKELESLGLKPKGPYKLVSPETQSWMPSLPDGAELYAGPAADNAQDAKSSVQVLLMPSTAAADNAKKPMFQLPRGIAWLTQDNDQLGVDLLDQEEKPTSPISQISGGASSITVLSGGSTKASATTVPNGLSWNLVPASSAK